MKKPKCPICEAEIQLSVVSVTSNNGGDSNWMGNSVSSKYLCKQNSDVCDVSRHIYTIVTGKTLRSSQDKNWRIPLGRYIEYVEFCIDNDLQQKLLSHSNKYGELDSKIHNFLLDEAKENQNRV